MRNPFKGLTLSDRWFNRLVIAAVALGFLLLVATGLAATATLLQNRDQARRVDHTYRVSRVIARYGVLSERLEAARRGYLLRRAPERFTTFVDTARKIGPTLSELARLSADNPRQQAYVKHAAELSRQHLRTLTRSVALVRHDHRAEAIASFSEDESVPLIRAIRKIVDRMAAEEDRLLEIRDADRKASLTLFLGIVTLAGVLLVIVAGGSLWIIVHYTSSLTRSRDALRLLNEDLEGAVRERTMDLQRANEEIQRFAYIVSHDLRSPLVNITGFTTELETATKRLARMMDKIEAHAPGLIDEEARLAAREDLPEAIGFIRSSTQKMDRLINAILRLSREGRRTITPEPLDMNALVQGVADMVKHRTDELGIEVTIQPGLPDIVSDRLAIEQILSNIVENAVKYLDPDRQGRIEIRGRTEGSRAVFEIADNGRGIDPKDHERIFDLFRRSGRQDRPGEGIGLAHTRALAYRLGGTINVESVLGRGAIFRINLPVAFMVDQGTLA